MSLSPQPWSKKNRRFIPETLVIPGGSTVSLPNLDPVSQRLLAIETEDFRLGQLSEGPQPNCYISQAWHCFCKLPSASEYGGGDHHQSQRMEAKADAAGRFTLPAFCMAPTQLWLGIVPFALLLSGSF
jgi:hypothetical protein